MANTAKKSPTIIIVASGTGGHVFPGIAIAESFVAREPDARVLFAGTSNGPEAEILKKTRWEFRSVGETSIHSGGVLNRMKAYLKIPHAILRSFGLMRNEMPDVVVGVGGFAAGPVLLAAAKKKIPTALVEPNAIAGRTNLKLARFASRVFVGFERTARQFPSTKAVVTGNPVRHDIERVNRRQYDGKRPLTVLCYGGSQGAKRLNELMIDAIGLLKGYEEKIQFIHQVGNYTPVETVAGTYRRAGFSSEVFLFSDRMADIYGDSDVAVARSGAGTVAELITVKLPAVLVPFPYAVDDHQKANAEEMVKLGGAIMTLERDLTGESLAGLLKEFADHPGRLQAMTTALSNAAGSSAADRIADECLKMIRGKDVQ